MSATRVFLFLACAALVSCSPSTKPVSIDVATGLNVPESALYDDKADLYLVSNINGSPFGEDGAGYIARVSPDGKIKDAKWIDGTKERVTLNAPKGMALTADTLYVADVTAVRKFGRATGAPRGSIDIPGVSFLNDMTVGADGTVYVSDTGMAAGFKPSGTDAVYAIGKDDKVKTLAKGPDLSQPNGLLATSSGVLVISWGRGIVQSIAADGKVTVVAKTPKAQLDGIIELKSGDYLVSSWEAKCLFRVAKDGSTDVAFKDLEAPADLGYDPKRNLVLTPLFNSKKLLIRSAP